MSLTKDFGYKNDFPKKTRNFFLNHSFSMVQNTPLGLYEISFIPNHGDWLSTQQICSHIYFQSAALILTHLHSIRKKISKAHIQQNVINFDCLKCVVGSNVPLDGVNAIENLVDVFKKPIKVHEGYLLNVPFWL